MQWAPMSSMTLGIVWLISLHLPTLPTNSPQDLRDLVPWWTLEARPAGWCHILDELPNIVVM